MDAVRYVINCTVLSNFATVDRIDLLRIVSEGMAATTEHVIQEFEAGVLQGYFGKISLEWLPVLAMTPEEEKTFEVIASRLGSGEASCLAIAQHRGAMIWTDDGDARRYARQSGVPVTGTLGILVRLVQNGPLSLDEANLLLAEMVKHGYYSPVTDLSLLLS
ncbi:hypothetical protein HRbin16_00579 [bacterium HR16]|nr:hypothetical protein HRbin16_00579 [bacterium HR16]